MEAKGKIVRTDEIAKLIWGEHFYSSINIKSYIHRLRQKMEENPANPTLIITEPGVGYFLAEKPPVTNQQIPIVQSNV
jgi:two-component system KDP operon response regulator KdpE